MSVEIENIFGELFFEKMPKDVFGEKNIDNYFKKNIETRDRELEEVTPPKELLRNLFGKKGNTFSDKIGTHPDFIDEENLPKNQYICSLFLDISGSTKLGLKFPLETVRLIKNALLRAAIEIFQVFDAHIHRLQGDAIFAYFGHKDMLKSEAIINAINAASLMQSYNKLTLSKFFEELNLSPLKIRVGLDIGDDSQVLWSSFGLGDIHEITTTSIHTDLAAKLQNRASVNSIMIGENIYKYMNFSDELLKIKNYTINKEQKDDRYIINDSSINAYYQMRVFDWEKYLNSFSFLPKETTYKYSAPKDFEIKCQYGNDEEGVIREYKSNTSAIDKNNGLAFKLFTKGILNTLKPHKITWDVENSGQQAREAGSLKFRMDDYTNEEICCQSTSYNGHHYMICTLYDIRNNIIGKEKFGIFVNDETIELKKLGV